jgi:hypothetical protein
MDTDFKVMDCALIAISTGEQAQNLRELRDRLVTTHHGCIYYHFWGSLLRPRFDDPEYQNDFAIWASRSLHDKRLAEQLSLIDPSIYPNLDALRQEIVEVIEQNLYESEYVPWAKLGDQFYFNRSQIVVFDSGILVKDPEQLVGLINHLPLGSIFYHFIDARRRSKEGRNDFSLWLDRLGEKYKPLSQHLDVIDPYFTTLNELRREIDVVFHDYITGGA